MPVTKTLRRVRATLAILLALVLATSTGCAALFNPVTQDVPVTTRPEGGEVWVDGKLVGTAPLTLRLDTRTKHDVTVRRGNDIRTWTLEQQVSSGSGLALTVDAAVLVSGGYCAVVAFEGAAYYASTYDMWDFGSWDIALGIGCIVVGLAPLAVDVATNHLNALQPREIAADFE